MCGCPTALRWLDDLLQDDRTSLEILKRWQCVAEHVRHAHVVVAIHALHPVALQDPRLQHALDDVSASIRCEVPSRMEPLWALMFQEASYPKRRPCRVTWQILAPFQ